MKLNLSSVTPLTQPDSLPLLEWSLDNATTIIAAWILSSPLKQWNPNENVDAAIALSLLLPKPVGKYKTSYVTNTIICAGCGEINTLSGDMFTTFTHAVRYCCPHCSEESNVNPMIDIRYRVSSYPAEIQSAIHFKLIDLIARR